MGWFSGIVKGVKKAVRGVKKAVRGVVKGVKKVASGIAKGVKKIGKTLSKTLSKMGPIASIAMGFMLGPAGLNLFSGPMFQGVTGAMAKGAITGFVTSGGQLKGALVGAAGGAIGYGAGKVFEGAKAGWNASEGGLTDKVGGALKGASGTISEGYENMYQAADTFVSGGGDVNAANAGEVVNKNAKIGYASATDAKVTATQVKDLQALGHGESMRVGDNTYTWDDNLGDFEVKGYDYTTDQAYTGEALGDIGYGEANPYAAEYGMEHGLTGPDAYKGYIESQGGYLKPELPSSESKTTSTSKDDKQPSLLGTSDWAIPQATIPDATKVQLTAAKPSQGIGGINTIQDAYMKLNDPDLAVVQQAQDFIAKHGKQPQVGYA